MLSTVLVSDGSTERSTKSCSLPYKFRIFFSGNSFYLLVCHKNLLRSKICFFLTLLSSLYARCFEWLGSKILFYHLSCHNRIHEHDRNICLQQPTSHILLGLVGFARNQLPGGFLQKISKK